MRNDFVRVLVAGETDVAVQYFKLFLNPSYTGGFVVLLHLRSMCLYVMPSFTSQGEMIRLSTKSAPTDRDKELLSAKGIDPSVVQTYMEIAGYWR